MDKLLKNKLTFIILAGCLILAFELLVLGSAKVEKKPVIEKAKPELKVVKTVYGPDWEDKEYQGGGHTATYYIGRRNYQTAEGTYQPIDTNIAASDDKTMQDLGYAYSMTKNDFHIYFKKNSNDSEAVRFQVRDSWVAYTFTDAQASEATYTGNTLTYVGIYPGIDLRYTITNDTLLEELVVKDKESVKEVEQKLTLGGVTFKQTKEGTLEFTKTGEKTVLWSFPAPIMYEDKDNTKASDQLSYVVTRRAGEVYLTRKIESAGQDWLAKASFPVVLDATATYRPEAVTNEAYWPGNANGQAADPGIFSFTSAGTEFDGPRYTNIIDEVGGNYASHTCTHGASLNNWCITQHNFRFYINPSVSPIGSISQIIINYAGDSDFTANTYSRAGSAELNTDGVVVPIGNTAVDNFNYTLTRITNNDDGTSNTSDDADYYLDASNYLWVRAYIKSRNNTTIGPSQTLKSDYIKVEVNYMTPPSGGILGPDPVFYSPCSLYSMCMTWYDTSTNESGWNLERSLTGSSWGGIGTMLSPSSGTASSPCGTITKPLNTWSCTTSSGGAGGYCDVENKCINPTILDTLTPNTRYYYRVRSVESGTGITSPWMRFRYMGTNNYYKYTEARAPAAAPTFSGATTTSISLNTWPSNPYPNQSTNDPDYNYNPDTTQYLYKVIKSDNTANPYYFDASISPCASPYSVLISTTISTLLGNATCTAGQSWGLGPFKVEAYSGTGVPLEPNTKFTFSLCARNGDNQQFCGPTADAWTLTNPPANFRHTGNTTNSITWAWEVPTAGANHFHLYYCQLNDLGNCPGSFTKIDNIASGAPGATITYTLGSLATNARYEAFARGVTPDDRENTTDSTHVKAYTSIETPTGVEFDIAIITSSTIPARATGTLTNLTTAGSSGTLIQRVSPAGNSGWRSKSNPYWSDSGRNANTQYCYQAQARNGDSEATGLSAQGCRYTLPNAPTGFTHPAGDAYNTTSSIYWQWTASAGGASSYKIYYKRVSDSTWLSQAGIATTSVTINVPNEPNTQYEAYVVAVNIDGAESLPSNPPPNTVKAYTTIQTPTGVSFGTLSSGSIAVTATGTFSNLTSGSSGIQFNKTGGADTTADNGFPGAVQPWIQTTPPTATDTGLSANVQYCYQAKARNGDSDETPLKPDTATCKYTYANPPINVTHDEASQTQTTMKWKWSTNNNSATTQYYAWDDKTHNTVGYNGDPDGWIPNLTEWVVSAYSSNLPITVTVRARNNEGVTTSSTLLTNAPDYTSIEAPTGVDFDVNSITPYAIPVKANGTLTNLNQGLSGTLIQRYNTAINSGWRVNSNNYWTNTSLQPNTQYCYEAKARNGDAAGPQDETGFSPQGANSCKYTHANIPGRPDLLRRDAFTIRVTIDPIDNPAPTQFAIKAKYTDAGGTPHEKCVDLGAGNTGTLNLDCSGTGDIDNPSDNNWWHRLDEWGGNSGMEVTSLDPNITYQFAVKARNADNIETPFGPAATLFLVAKNVVGWAWSPNVGWISSNCLNLYNRDTNPNFKFGYSCDLAGNWGLNTDYEADRANNINPVTGYAWAGSDQAQKWQWPTPVNVSWTTRAAGADVTGDQYENGPSIALDSKGYPHIAWVEKQGNAPAIRWDIYYIEWNGSKWVKADGTDYTHTELPTDRVLNVSHAGFAPRNYISVAPSLALYNNKPYIAFDGGASANNIFFLKWNGSDWVTVTGVVQDTAYNDPLGSKLLVGYEYGPSLAMDTKGNPHIVFENLVDNGDVPEVYYVEWNSISSKWVTATGVEYIPGTTNPITSKLNVSYTSARSSNAKLVMGNETPQRPHIVWGEDVTGWDSGQIYYRWWNGTAWVDINPADGNNDDVQVNKNITGLFAPPPSWATGTTPPDDNNGGRPSIALYADNTPGIVWRDFYQIVYRKWNQTLDKWTTVSDDNPTAGANLRLDNFEYGSGYAVSPMVAIYNDQPYVVFTHSITEGSKGQVYFRRWNGTAWVDQAGNNGSGSGGENVGILSQPANIEAGSPDLAVDSSGRPHVIWWENTLENLGSGSCLISHCLSDADCSDLNFSQCVYYQGTDKTCANARNQSCTLDTQCPLNPPPQNCNNECNRCSAFDIYYTGWLSSSEPTGLGWLSANIKSCDDDKQRACVDDSDCKTGACNFTTAGVPPDSASQYGYCEDGSGYKYGNCKLQTSTSCTEQNQATQCNTTNDYCVYTTCKSGDTCPASGTCKLISTANFNSATAEVEGWLRSLSLKEYGTTYGYNDWGWAKLSGSYGGLGADKDTVGLWHFTEGTGIDAHDSSVYRNNGTLLDANTGNADGNTPPQWVDGKFGKALRFDGVDDYVDVGKDISLSINGASPYTYEVWVKPTSIASTNKQIIGRGTESNNQMYLLGYQATTGKVGVWHYANDFLDTNATLIAGQWNYITNTYDGTTERVFLNGVETKNRLASGFNLDNSKNVYIGRHTGNYSDQYFNGIIDEVRVTKRALSSTEIENEYKNEGLYRNSSISVGAEEFLGDPSIDPTKVILYSIFGWAWAGASSPGLGWLELMPAGSLVGIPWLQTQYSDIFGRTGIQLAPAPRGSGLYNATYLIVSGTTISGISGLYVPISVTGPPTSAGTGLLESRQENYPNLLASDVLRKVDVAGLSTKVPGTDKNKYGYSVITEPTNDVDAALGATPTLDNKVYYFNGDATVDNKITFKNADGVNYTSGAGLIIVNGDLTINADITYEGGSTADIKYLASAAWIVKGNINIAPGVSQLAGVFVSLGTGSGGKITTSSTADEATLGPVAIAASGGNGIAWNTGGKYCSDAGTQWSNTNDLKFGWDNTNQGAYRSYLRWILDIPSKAEIRQASISVNSLSLTGIPFTGRVGLLNTDSASNFIDSPCYIVESPPSGYNIDAEKNFSATAGLNLISGIESLVQRFVDRAGYNPGNYIGFSLRRDTNEITGPGDNAYCTFNTQTGNPTQLSITYRTSLNVSGAFVAGSYDFGRLYKRGDLPAESVNYDGRVVANTPPGLQDFSNSLPVFQRVTPQKNQKL